MCLVSDNGILQMFSIFYFVVKCASKNKNQLTFGQESAKSNFEKGLSIEKIWRPIFKMFVCNFVEQFPKGWLILLGQS